MKILIENELFKMSGGTETISISMYEMLKVNNHKVYFFATKSDSYYEENYEYIKYFPKNVYSTKEYLKNPLAYYYNFEAAKLFKQMLKEVKPQLVHLNLLLSPSIINVCHELKIPMVMTVHTSAPFCPSANLLLNNKNICCDFKCKDGNYWHCIFNNCKNSSMEASIRKALLSELYKRNNSYKKIKKFICPSIALKNLLLETNIGINNADIKVINNFLSDKDINTTPKYINKGYFLYIGRLVKEKGVHYLLEAMKDLPKDIEVHIVGKGSEEERLKRYTKENNLDNIKFLGFKNRDEIKQEYQNCIATILPCNWFENFPTTNMESFINGKPVIASKIGGIPEQVENDKTGLLFEPTNIEQLKECIMKYWTNNNLVKTHGINAYSKAKMFYNSERYYNELIALYKEVLGEYDV